jgi:hypothetical protein
LNIVDSSGWLEYFADGPNADSFAAPLAERQGDSHVGSVGQKDSQ